MRDKIISREIGRDAMFKIWHASEFATFIYTYSDGGSIVCGEGAYPIRAGVLCFIGAGKHHYTMPSEPQKYERSKLFISAKKLHQLLSIISKDTAERFSEGAFVYAELPEESRREIEAEFDALVRVSDCDELFSLRHAALAIRLASLCKKYLVESVPRVTGTVSRAVEYINENIFDELTIDDIAGAIHVSKYYFCRKFREATKMTVMKYVLKTRIVIASEMLLKERCSLTEISSRCGFSSVSYFSRAFKREVGISPLEYRKIGCSDISR